MKIGGDCSSTTPRSFCLSVSEQKEDFIGCEISNGSTQTTGNRIVTFVINRSHSYNAAADRTNYCSFVWRRRRRRRRRHSASRRMRRLTLFAIDNKLPIAIFLIVGGVLPSASESSIGTVASTVYIYSRVSRSLIKDIYLRPHHGEPLPVADFFLPIGSIVSARSRFYCIVPRKSRRAIACYI